MTEADQHGSDNKNRVTFSSGMIGDRQYEVRPDQQIMIRDKSSLYGINQLKQYNKAFLGVDSKLGRNSTKRHLHMQ